ncbi:MAG: hypothetical protein WDW38_010074 [Sanguina aurantia]
MTLARRASRTGSVQLAAGGRGIGHASPTVMHATDTHTPAAQGSQQHPAFLTQATVVSAATSLDRTSPASSELGLAVVRASRQGRGVNPHRPMDAAVTRKRKGQNLPPCTEETKDQASATGDGGGDLAAEIDAALCDRDRTRDPDAPPSKSKPKRARPGRVDLTADGPEGSQSQAAGGAVAGGPCALFVGGGDHVTADGKTWVAHERRRPGGRPAFGGIQRQACSERVRVPAGGGPPPQAGPHSLPAFTQAAAAAPGCTAALGAANNNGSTVTVGALPCGLDRASYRQSGQQQQQQQQQQQLAGVPLAAAAMLTGLPVAAAAMLTGLPVAYVRAATSVATANPNSGHPRQGADGVAVLLHVEDAAGLPIAHVPGAAAAAGQVVEGRVAKVDIAADVAGTAAAAAAAAARTRHWAEFATFFHA